MKAAWIVWAVAFLAGFLGGCKSSENGPVDAGGDGAVDGSFDAASDTSVDVPERQPSECDEILDAFGSVGTFSVRESTRGRLLYAELRVDDTTWTGLYVDAGALSAGDAFDLEDEPLDPTRCRVCLLRGTACSDPTDPRSCEVLRMAARGRAVLLAVPSAAGEDAVLELADVFFEPLALDWRTLRSVPLEGPCGYQRFVSFMTRSVTLGSEECRDASLACRFAER
jgi:hypothetical protein